VHAQLPRRLARRLVDLQLLPHVVVSNPHVQRVYHAYAHAFDVLRALPPPSTLEGNARFCALLRRLVDEHAPMLGHLAQGLREVKARPLLGPALDLDGFLDAMLRSRVSRRLLAEHHLALSAMLSSGGGGGGGGGGGSGGGGGGAHAGCVDSALDLREAVEFAAQRTALACLEAYGVAPEVAVVVSAGGGGGGHDSGAAAPPPLPRPPKTAHLPYVASHLDYMVSEILKNAMRAVSERHLGERAAAHARFGGGAAAAAARPPPPLPPLRPPPAVVVRICAPPGGDVTLRFSDQGGGIDPSHERSVWQYGWTTVGKSGGGGRGGAAAAAAAVGDRDAGVGFGGGAASAAGAARHEMAGLGFGLPLTRLYARYFGGELALQNMPGYGVDAFLTLRRLELPPSGRVAAAAGAAAAAASPPPPPSSLLSAAEAEAAALAAAAGWHGGDGAARPSDEPPLPGDAPQAPGVAAAASAASSVHAAQKDADLLSDVRRRRERARRERRLQKRGGAAAAAAAEAADGVASSDDEEDL
jgi:[3-methyl-2-oxobutanoate dehydrogenase (acetyl-transferring)] kinase